MKVVERKARGEMTGAPPAGVTTDVEVVAKAERRRFTAHYKRRIVREADRCTQPGEIGALLRREGLYSSLLTKWREARDRGELEGLSPKQRGPKVAPPDPRAKKIAEQEREITRWKKRAERAWRRPRRRDRPLFGACEPVKKHGPGTAADLRVVTPRRSRLGK